MQDVFKASATHAADLLESHILYATDLFRALEDPEAGFDGARMLGRMHAQGLGHVEARDDFPSMASYVPFSRTEKRSFVNEIHYRRHHFAPTPMPESYTPEARSRVDVVGSLLHEISHADSWDRVPELHATPFNAYTPVILCPEDFVRMTCLTERVAYGNAAWLTSLALEHDPAMRGFVTPVNGDMFTFLRGRGRFDHALYDAGELSMKANWGKDIRNGEPMTMEQYYQWQALSNYEYIVGKCLEDGKLPWVVRLEEHNIASMLQSFAPGIGHFAPQVSPLRVIDRDWVDRIYGKLRAEAKVERYENLPCFDARLASYGYTPQSFLEMSRNAGRDVAVPARPRALCVA